VKTSDFDYILPPERIAQTPVEPRHSSRMFVLNRKTNRVEHTHFFHLPDYLKEGDVLVINRTRVITARLKAMKDTGGKIEILLLRKEDDVTWEVMVGGKGLLEHRMVLVVNGPAGEIVKVLDGPRRLVRFEQPVEGYLHVAGEMPLPPYITTPLRDQSRYQTVYAERTGSAAAPTAGLHFTSELMQTLENMGVIFAEVTLHVGLDTFAPVNEEDPLEHKIHTEWCEITDKTVQIIQSARQRSNRVIAVGTTSVRTLETAARNVDEGEILRPFTGPTDLFILPGYQFRVVDAMITNFHLPRSTLLMLVSAFAGRECVLEAYQEAVRLNYRFYSFGDAMFIE